MTDILNNLTNDVGSDREDIQKLFPKCKPKSDVNLNKLIISDSSKHQQHNNRNNIFSEESVTSGRCHGGNVGDSFLANRHHNENSLFRADDAISSSASSSNSICHVNNFENTVVENNYRDHMVIVDNTVVSAYDMDMDNCHKVNGAAPLPPSQHQQPEEDESAYDESLDVGYRIPVMRKEFKLRESRIEIAGGREVFSSSRSRPSKKRFSDEIQFRPAAPENQHNRDATKRHSGSETLYDDHVVVAAAAAAAASSGAYQLKTASAVTRKSATAEIVSLRSSHQSNGQWTAIKHQNRFKARTTTAAAASRLNKVTCNVDDSPSDPLYNSADRMSIVDRGSGTGSGMFQDNERDIVTPEVTSSKQRDTFVLKGQRSGMFIYETVVRGSSEVVYDDIEEHRTCFKQAEVDADAAEQVEEVMTTSERDDVGSPPSEVGIGFVSSSDRVETDVVGVVAASAAGQALADADTMDDDDDDDDGVVVDEKISVTQTQLIGSLPIAQYEGSPRRYGPRPGHPQRMTMVSDVTTSVAGATSDDGEMMTSPNDVIANADSSSLMVADGGDNDVIDGRHCPSEGSSLDGGGMVALPPASYSSFSTYDYLYEESETRKVLEEFYHQDGLFERLKAAAGTLSVDAFNELEYRLYRNHAGNSYVGRRLAHSNVLGEVEDSPKKRRSNAQLLREHLLAATLNSIVAGSGDKPCLSKENLYNFNLELGSCFQPTSATTTTAAAAAGSLLDHVEDHNKQLAAASLPQAPPPDGETATSTGGLDSTEDLAETEVGEQVGQSRNFTLSPETTECDSNDVESEVSMENEGSLHSSSRQYASMPVLEDGLSSGGHSSEAEEEHDDDDDDEDDEDDADDDDDEDEDGAGSEKRSRSSDHHVLTTLMMKKQISEIEREIARRAHNRADKSSSSATTTTAAAHGTAGGPLHRSIHLQQQQHFQQPHVQPSPVDYREVEDYLRRCDTMSLPVESRDVQPVPLATDPLEHMLDSLKVTASSPLSTNQVQRPPPLNSSITCESVSEAINEIKQAIQRTKSITLKSPPMEKPEAEDVPVWVLRPTFKHKPTNDEEEGGGGRTKEDGHEEDECDTDQETDRLLGEQRSDDPETFDDKRLSDLPSTQPPSSPITNADPSASLLSQEKEAQKKKGRTKEVLIHEPAVLIEGVLFRARYLGSTQLVCEGQPTKATRMMQAEEAVSSIKAPEGETQPSTEVDLFISTEKIMVLNTDLKEIMMDHALRTISYIADIGDLVVLMARRRVMSTTDDLEPKLRRTPKMICHVFESEEAQFIAQSIGQAFQVAYMEFLKANGIEDHSFVKEMDYQEVLNSQEIYGDELEMFAKKEMQKEVIVPKLKGEILGVVIVESGWGSMLPTVVIANLSPNGAAARCGQLNIGDQIIAVNGISLVGLPLSTCQNYVKNAKNQTVVKLTVVPCAPVVEVKIKRPDTKYQLGFSVQNGVICSLLRGGIAERGGVRVGHRIIEINGQSVVAVPHERIVNLLATSVGEIHMKTMPTSMFRLLTGQESPIFI